MKNIIIIGPSRVGKSTLASILCEKYNFNYISGNSIRNALIIGIGCKEIQVEELKNKILKYDINLDWTYGYSEEDLLSISKETINNSINLYNECISNNICYFDTSLDRYETYNDIYKYIESNIEV